MLAPVGSWLITMETRLTQIAGTHSIADVLAGLYSPCVLVKLTYYFSRI